ncbi:RNA polymerase-associated protein RTF1, partial [Lecanoromycetidae sp. Uapishka_2]
MDVEDAELLALAGGDSSDEEDTKPTISKAVSPLPSIEVSQPAATGSNSTPRVSTKRGGNNKAMKKTRKDDSEEDGEASSTPASPNSLQSAPMSESDSDSSPVDEGATGGPLFPVDNKFYSEKDKKHVMSLSEIEREALLAERAALLEQQTQNQHLRRLLEARQKQEAKAGDKKRKALDLEDSPRNRKSSRQKTTLGGRKVGETSNAIEEYKRQREEKGIRDKQRRLEAADRKNRRARSSSDTRYSSADADGESEVEWDDGKPKVDEDRIRKEPKADYTDVRRATLPRNLFADYCFYPGFGEAVRDCFVRIPLAESKNGQMTYKMVLIKDIIEKEGFDYAMEKKNGKKFVTNQHAMLVIDGSPKEFHFNGISNSSVTEAEVANYGNAMEDAGKQLPTKRFLQQKILDVEAVMKHTFTEAELQEKLRRSGALRTGSAYEREAINTRRRAAVENEDEAAIAKCDAELAALNGPKLMYGTILAVAQAQPTAPAAPSQQDRLAELNIRNRKANREDVRKAQLAERKAERLAREAVQRGEALQNPFARVKTYAKTHHDVNAGLTPHRAGQQVSSRDISRSGTPTATAKSAPKPEETKRAFPSPPQLFTASGMPMLGSRNMDDEIIASLDMGIDIEL